MHVGYVPYLNSNFWVSFGVGILFAKLWGLDYSVCALLWTHIAEFGRCTGFLYWNALERLFPYVILKCSYDCN